MKNVIGLIPAAGNALRLSPLPCSKEVLPIEFGAAAGKTDFRPKVVCHYLLEKLGCAGIKKAFIILRNGKWDIPAYFGDGHRFGLHVAYLISRYPYGVPFTLDQAFPFVENEMVALGFPDILFQPVDVFALLLQRQSETQADVVLSLHRTHAANKCDMIEFDRSGQILRFVIKPVHTELDFTWTAAVWTPEFSRFMHQYLSGWLAQFAKKASLAKGSTLKELYIGDVLQAALNEGMHIDCVKFPNENCIDIGTPEDLLKVIRQ